MSWEAREGQSSHREKYFMALFLKRANRRPEPEGGLLDPGLWESFSGGQGGGARWLRGRGSARRLQDRKFGRKESARTKTDLTDPPNDFTDKRISGGEVSAFEVLLLDCFRFFFLFVFCFVLFSPSLN